MRLDFTFDESAVSAAEEEFVPRPLSAQGSAEAEKALQSGIAAAQSGRRAEARQKLLRATEIDPKNEDVWLWLASISEYPEELLVFLNNVLDINPENTRAQEWAKATKALLAKTFVQRGIDAVGEDQSHFARQCFLQAIVHDNHNEMAWLWLASIAETDEERAGHLNRVLEIDPKNETALKTIKSIRAQKARSILANARASADEGHTSAAQTFIEKALEICPDLDEAWLLKSRLANSLEEKIECCEKVLKIAPANEEAKTHLEALRAEIENAGNENDQEDLETEFMNREAAGSDYFTDATEDRAEKSGEDAEQPDEANVADSGAATIYGFHFGEQFVSADAPTQDYNLPEIIEPYSENFFENAAPDETEREVRIESPAADQEIWSDHRSPSEPADDNILSFADYAPERETVPAENVAENVLDDFAASNAESCSPFDAGQSAEANIGAGDTAYSSIYSGTSAENATFEPFGRENSAGHFAVDENDFAPSAENVPAADVQNGEYSAVTDAEISMPADFEENSYYPARAMENPSENSYAEMPGEDYSETLYAPAISDSGSATGETVDCPFCRQENEPQAFVCRTCRAMLTLSDLEMLLAHPDADQETLRKAVEQMEVEDNRRGLEAEELIDLAIGYINLKNPRRAMTFLQKASKLKPNNVVLDSQINSLAIRLAEIEEKQNAQSALPKDKLIMVIDDSATVRKLISGKLEKCGHTVITAVDGVDAMEQLNDIVPDLILLDINMPRMDGYQVCKLIRNNETTKEVPVVMISGKDGFFDKVRGRMAGTTSYITKPFGPEALMKMLETYLN